MKDIIRGRQILNRIIKETIWSWDEEKISFPKTIFFCDGIGQPTFKITIEKVDADTFIDGTGQKWVKAK